jgi:hypothetical protein
MAASSGNDPADVHLVPYQPHPNLVMGPRGGGYDWLFNPDDLRQRLAGGMAGNPTLMGILRRLYPEAVHEPPPRGSEVAGLIGNNQAIGDRQVTTMGAIEHRPTGPYTPPAIVRPTFPAPPIDEHMLAAAHANPGDISTLAHLLLNLYPRDQAGGGRVPIVNSQAIGDRSPTTMTNPLSAYRPTTMVNTPLAHQVATMIAQHLASQPKPLVNTPLAGAATQMGNILATRLQR